VRIRSLVVEIDDESINSSNIFFAKLKILRKSSMESMNAEANNAGRKNSDNIVLVRWNLN